MPFVLVLLFILFFGCADVDIPPKSKNKNEVLSKGLEKALKEEKKETNPVISRSNFERFNQSKKDWYSVFLRTLSLYKIVNPEMYLTNIIFESGGFLYEVENLNYTAHRLDEIFHTHFLNKQERKRYAHHPKMIANRVYANRLGNGAETSGDGWKFRGRGFLQVTGKYNYELLAKEYNKIVQPATLITSDDMVLFAESHWGAMHVSSLWWRIAHCNNEHLTVEEVTKKISGSERTAPERDLIYKKIISYKD